MLPICYWYDPLEQAATEPSEIEFVVKEVFRGIFAIAGVLFLLAVMAMEGYLYECVNMRPQALRNYRYGIGCVSFAKSIASRSLQDLRPTSVQAQLLSEQLTEISSSIESGGRRSA